MIKTYKSQTNIAINVYIAETNSNAHVVFIPMSDGSSYFITEDEELQKNIERHHGFGKLFYLAQDNQGAVAQQEEEVPEEKAPEILVIPVADMGEAKDYLADKFGISRTSLKSSKAIKEQALAHGIEFEGI